MSRQHPAETLPSYLAQYMMEQLLFNDSPESWWLREEFEWIFIPMINVDGVEVGNARCDATGNDPNRNWPHPRKDLFPILHAIKNIKHGQLAMVLDLHGHSRRINAFAYGCQKDPIKCRVFPVILDSLSHMFNMEQCCFQVSVDKMKTARWLYFDYFQCDLTYTIEVSYGSYDKNLGRSKHINLDDLQKLAADMMKSIFLTFEGDREVDPKTRPKLNRERAIEKIKDNQEYYNNLNKNGGDRSDTDSDISLEAIELDDYKEEKIKEKAKESAIKVKTAKTIQIITQTQEIEKVSKPQKLEKRKTLKVSTSKLDTIQKSTSPPTQQTQHKFRERSTTVTYQRESIKTIPHRQDPSRTEASPRLSPRTTFSIEKTPSPLKNQLPKVSKAVKLPNRLNHLANKSTTLDLDRHRHIKTHQSPARSYMMEPVTEIQTKPRFQEKIRQREKLTTLKLLMMTKMPIVREDPRSRWWQDRLTHKGNVRFMPFEEEKRVHSQLRHKTPQRKPKTYALKSWVEAEEYQMHLSFFDHELDPQSIH